MGRQSALFMLCADYAALLGKNKRRLRTEEARGERCENSTYSKRLDALRAKEKPCDQELITKSKTTPVWDPCTRKLVSNAEVWMRSQQSLRQYSTSVVAADNWDKVRTVSGSPDNSNCIGIRDKNEQSELFQWTMPTRGCEPIVWDISRCYGEDQGTNNARRNVPRKTQNHHRVTKAWAIYLVTYSVQPLKGQPLEVDESPMMSL